MIRCALLLAVVGLACAGPPHYGPDGPPFVSPRGCSSLPCGAALGGVAPAHRLILIGDAGTTASDDATLADLGRWSAERPDDTTVAFLGDNLYSRGLGEDDERGERILLQQLRASRAKKIFVPGNHDWGDPWLDAETLAREERFIDGYRESPATLLPKGGCPGPALETLVNAGAGLARGVQLMAIDLDWWLIGADERPACPGIAGEPDFVQALGRALRANADQHVVVVAHHPLRTGGPHGGHRRVPFMRQLVTLAGWLGITVHDLDGAVYRRMLDSLRPALASQPPLVFASGHEHALQVIEDSELAGTLVVSGAGSPRNITTVTAIAGTLFAHAHPGFVVLDFHGDADSGDRVVLRVIETGHALPVFEMQLPLR